MDDQTYVVADQFVFIDIIAFLFCDHLLKYGVQKIPLLWCDLKDWCTSDLKKGRLLQAFGTFRVLEKISRKKNCIAHVSRGYGFPGVGNMRVAKKEYRSFLFKAFVSIMDLTPAGCKADLIKFFPAIDTGLITVLLNLECSETF